MLNSGHILTHDNYYAELRIMSWNHWPFRKDFEKAFVYKPLDHDNQEIRLIILSTSSDFNAPLRCRMRHERPGRKASYGGYQTLSYAWGDPKMASSIEVSYADGSSIGRLGITANLDVALRRIRAKRTQGWSRFARFPLWVDAICIDQSNNAEKGHQVRLMAEIYKASSRLIIWLAAEQTCLDGDSVAALIKWSRDTWNYEPDPNVMEAFDGLQKLLQSTWFERRWCIQEVLNSAAEDACILFESSYINCADWLTLILRANSQRQGLLEQAGVLASSWEGYNRGMLENLQRFDRYQCGNDKDLIYALLSISRDRTLETSPLWPDYGLESERLFCDIAKRYCTVQFMIPLLICATTRRKDHDWHITTLPSWVPDWRNKIRYDSDHHQKIVKDHLHFCNLSDSCCDKSWQHTSLNEDVARSNHNSCCQYRLWSDTSSAHPSHATATGVEFDGDMLVLRQPLIFRQECEDASDDQSWKAVTEDPAISRLEQDEAIMLLGTTDVAQWFGREAWCSVMHRKMESRFGLPADHPLHWGSWAIEPARYHPVCFVLKTIDGQRARRESIYRLHSCATRDFELDTDLPLPVTEVRIR